MKERWKALLASLGALAAGLFFAWCARAAGGAALHYVEVRSWEVKRCRVEGRRLVGREQSPFPGFISSTFRTIEYDLRDLETDRLYPHSLDSPYAGRYGGGADGGWEYRHAPFTEADCRVDPDGERAYLEAESLGFILLVGAGFLFFAGSAGALLLGGLLQGVRVLGASWEA